MVTNAAGAAMVSALNRATNISTVTASLGVGIGVNRTESYARGVSEPDGWGVHNFYTGDRWGWSAPFITTEQLLVATRHPVAFALGTRLHGMVSKPTDGSGVVLNITVNPPVVARAR